MRKALSSHCQQTVNDGVCIFEGFAHRTSSKYNNFEPRVAGISWGISGLVYCNNKMPIFGHERSNEPVSINWSSIRGDIDQNEYVEPRRCSFIGNFWAYMSSNDLALLPGKFGKLPASQGLNSLVLVVLLSRKLTVNTTGLFEISKNPRLSFYIFLGNAITLQYKSTTMSSVLHESVSQTELMLRGETEPRTRRTPHKTSAVFHH